LGSGVAVGPVAPDRHTRPQTGFLTDP